jgi:hypothetical protein
MEISPGYLAKYLKNKQKCLAKYFCKLGSFRVSVKTSFKLLINKSSGLQRKHPLPLSHS